MVSTANARRVADAATALGTLRVFRSKVWMVGQNLPGSQKKYDGNGSPLDGRKSKTPELESITYQQPWSKSSNLSLIRTKGNGITIIIKSVTKSVIQNEYSILNVSEHFVLISKYEFQKSLKFFPHINRWANQYATVHTMMKAIMPLSPWRTKGLNLCTQNTRL